MAMTLVLPMNGNGSGTNEINASDGTMMVATGAAIESLLEQVWGFRKDKEGKRVKILCEMVLQGCVDDLVSTSSIQPSSVQPPLSSKSPPFRTATTTTTSTTSYASLRAAVINGTATLSTQVTAHP